MILALTIGLLVAGAVYLLLQRDLLRTILGFVLLSHAVNLLLFSAGGTTRRGEPLGSDPDPATTADPLPQAFVLTAIVIAFAITIYLLVLAVTGRQSDVTDEDDDDAHRQPRRPRDPGAGSATDGATPHRDEESQRGTAPDPTEGRAPAGRAPTEDRAPTEGEVAR